MSVGSRWRQTQSLDSAVQEYIRLYSYVHVQVSNSKCMYIHVHVNKAKQGKANGSTQGRQLISKKKAELP